MSAPMLAAQIRAICCTVGELDRRSVMHTDMHASVATLGCDTRFGDPNGLSLQRTLKLGLCRHARLRYPRCKVRLLAVVLGRAEARHSGPRRQTS